jgi:RHS repeat-associated protein
VGKQLDGVIQERYIYDGDDIALVVNAMGTLIERYLYGDSTDSVLAVERDGTISWSLGDRQGSVVDLVDEGGTVLNHFVYDSFGNRTQTSGVEFRYGYTGRELDGETGLYYYRARYYAPTTGRFISEDPMGFGAGDTNLYRYVFNSPTNFVDPTGEFANVAAGAGFGALFGGLYALANDIESGNFGWNTFGNVLKGAAVGAVVGAAISVGLAGATNVLAAGFQAVLGAETALGVATAGTIVNTTAAAATTVSGAYNAGGNFGRGKYLTGALDLFGAAAAARNVVNGVKGFETARLTDLASAIDNLPMPGSPAGSSALANRTAVGGAISPYSHPSAGQLVLANSAGRALTGATDTGQYGLVYSTDDDPLNAYYIIGLGKEIARNPISMEAYTRLGELGVPIHINFVDAPIDRKSGLRIAGEYIGEKIYLYKLNTSSQKQLIEYMIHEGVHAERRSGMMGRTMYEEYLAFTKQLTFRNDRAPTMQESRELWDWISNEAYSNIPVGQNPFGD